MSADPEKPPSPLRTIGWPVAGVLLGGLVAAFTMLGVGLAFNWLEAGIPAIGTEYENKAIFRDWPGWSQAYMWAHPVWFGFVFAAGFSLVRVGRTLSGWGMAAGCGLAYGVMVFLVGSLPVFALIYASFRVSPELVAVSWAARNLTQYAVAGLALGLLANVWRVVGLQFTSRARDLSVDGAWRLGMAFGFPAYYTEFCTLDATQDEESCQTVVRALESLGWSIKKNLGYRISAHVNVNFWSWGERIVVRFFGEGNLCLTSKCLLPTQCFDWGKNQQNVIRLIAEFRKVEKLSGMKRKKMLVDPPIALDSAENGGSQDIQESRDRIR